MRFNFELRIRPTHVVGAAACSFGILRQVSQRTIPLPDIGPTCSWGQRHGTPSTCHALDLTQQGSCTASSGLTDNLWLLSRTTEYRITECPQVSRHHNRLLEYANNSTCGTNVNVDRKRLGSAWLTGVAELLGCFSPQASPRLLDRAETARNNKRLRSF